MAIWYEEESALQKRSECQLCSIQSSACSLYTYSPPNGDKEHTDCITTEARRWTSYAMATLISKATTNADGQDAGETSSGLKCEGLLFFTLSLRLKQTVS